MAQHQIVKPEKLAATAVGMLEQELIVPNLFQKEGIDQFKGAADDTVSVKVEGVLPFHEYGFRNDRSSAITFDEYSERKVAVQFGGNFYSAVQLTDEQNDFDIESWAKLLNPQVKAVARGLGRRAVTTLEDQAYAVTIGADSTKLRTAIIEARRVMNRFQVPGDERILLVGTDFESALLNDEKITLAVNAGDAQAASALHEATVGRIAGFTIVVDQTIQPDAAYAMVRSAFIFMTGAPAVPSSVPFGATQSFESIAMRWVRDYDPSYMRDRSVVNTYAGFRAVEDVLVGWDEANGKELVSSGEHFVRAIKLELDGTSVYPEAGSELAVITGVTDPTPAG